MISKIFKWLFLEDELRPIFIAFFFCVLMLTVAATTSKSNNKITEPALTFYVGDKEVTATYDKLKELQDLTIKWGIKVNADNEPAVTVNEIQERVR